MVKSAKALHAMIKDDDNPEPWVEEKIALASESIITVAQYMEYEKARGK